MDEQSLPILIR